jgi:hypothetical protein
MPKDQKRYRSNLRDHFDFSELRRTDCKSLRGRDAAQPADGKFSTYNNDYHPGFDDLELHKGNKCGRDQQLIRYGIQKDADCCNLTSLSGQVAIQEIGKGSRHKNERGDKHVIFSQKQNDQQRDGEDTDES